MAGEFGGLGPAFLHDPGWEPAPSKAAGEATPIAIVATDAALTRAEAQRMAIAAHDGIARALVPSHTLLDGDLVFAAATGAQPLADPVADQFALGHAAACCLARAIARAVYLARPEPGDLLPAWSARFNA
jgi:D-aminopeptidase